MLLKPKPNPQHESGHWLVLSFQCVLPFQILRFPIYSAQTHKCQRIEKHELQYFPFGQAQATGFPPLVSNNYVHCLSSCICIEQFLLCIWSRINCYSVWTKWTLVPISSCCWDLARLSRLFRISTWPSCDLHWRWRELVCLEFDSGPRNVCLDWIMAK